MITQGPSVGQGLYSSLVSALVWVVSIVSEDATDEVSSALLSAEVSSAPLVAVSSVVVEAVELAPGVDEGAAALVLVGTLLELVVADEPTLPVPEDELEFAPVVDMLEGAPVIATPLEGVDADAGTEVLAAGPFGTGSSELHATSASAKNAHLETLMRPIGELGLEQGLGRKRGWAATLLNAFGMEIPSINRSNEATAQRRFCSR